jgi:inosine-uridine nucleoside N-ribohydrolase
LLAQEPIANPHAEWNFYMDLYAAGVVFQAGVPLTLIPLDATNQVPVNLTFYARLKAQHSTSAATFGYELLTENPTFFRSGEYHFWDSLTATTLTDDCPARQGGARRDTLLGHKR